MGTIRGAATSTAFLTLSGWIFFRVTMPDDPLTPAETSFLALLALTLVLGRGWLWRQLRRIPPATRTAYEAVSRFVRAACARIGRLLCAVCSRLPLLTALSARFRR